jgi:hypothetical protein
MTIEDLKHAKDKRPFRPFIMRMANGREIEVRHPDAVAWGNELSQSVTHISPNNDWEQIDIAVIVSLAIPAPAKPTAGNGE